ncbi:hypothetical protein [Promicromonospora sp. NPDC050880]|uniref:hypothetical protein n=1 Tax=Promicromonospora sp. NPDC050880 TaxID=3364406 RepID=UPI00378C9610
MTATLSATTDTPDMPECAPDLRQDPPPPRRPGHTRERRERLGISYVVVGQELTEAFDPVRRILAGE